MKRPFPNIEAECLQAGIRIAERYTDDWWLAESDHACPYSMSYNPNWGSNLRYQWTVNDIDGIYDMSGWTNTLREAHVQANNALLLIANIKREEAEELEETEELEEAEELERDKGFFGVIL